MTADRFKFRVWDTGEKEMSEPFGLFDMDGDYCIPFDRTIGDVHDDISGILMQSTGLKDKNGILIFEGDIVKDSNKIFTVIFECGCFMYKERMMSYEATHWSANREIIGNIHEHPELLSKQQQQ